LSSSGIEPEDRQQQKTKQKKSDQDDKPKEQKKVAMNSQETPCTQIKSNQMKNVTIDNIKEHLLHLT
jgi:hypothetical protein